MCVMREIAKARSGRRSLRGAEMGKALELRGELTAHEILDGVPHRLVLVQYTVRLDDDRQLDPELVPEVESALRGLHALGNMTEARQNVGELPAFSELQAHRP